MSLKEYHQLLRYLYFEGYTDSYAEAEELLNEVTDDEFEDILCEFYNLDERFLGPSQGYDMRKDWQKREDEGGTGEFERHQAKEARLEAEQDRFRKELKPIGKSRKYLRIKGGFRTPEGEIKPGIQVTNRQTGRTRVFFRKDPQP